MADNDPVNYFEVLGLRSNASEGDVTRAYQRVLREAGQMWGEAEKQDSEVLRERAQQRTAAVQEAWGHLGAFRLPGDGALISEVYKLYIPDYAAGKRAVEGSIPMAGVTLAEMQGAAARYKTEHKTEYDAAVRAERERQAAKRTHEKMTGKHMGAIETAFNAAMNSTNPSIEEPARKVLSETLVMLRNERTTPDQIYGQFAAVINCMDTTTNMAQKRLIVNCADVFNAHIMRDVMNGMRRGHPQLGNTYDQYVYEIGQAQAFLKAMSSIEGQLQAHQANNNMSIGDLEKLMQSVDRLVDATARTYHTGAKQAEAQAGIALVEQARREGDAAIWQLGSRTIGEGTVQSYNSALQNVLAANQEAQGSRLAIAQTGRRYNAQQVTAAITVFEVQIDRHLAELHAAGNATERSEAIRGIAGAMNDMVFTARHSEDAAAGAGLVQAAFQVLGDRRLREAVQGQINTVGQEQVHAAGRHPEWVRQYERATKTVEHLGNITQVLQSAALQAGGPQATYTAPSQQRRV